MPHQVGDRVHHFQLVESLGSGSMGEVFRATDEKLKREVALKFPAADLIGDPTTRARFVREAEMLAGLRHPAIPVLFEFHETPGDEFLCMEFVKGETLEARIQRGALSEREVIDLAIQLADGLAAAHGAGVLHRDLKPANLMITPEGRLRILDFGLARPLQFGTKDDLTARDTVPGTLPYLAPELLTGGEPSERSDLYAVGLVLYEAATGSRPFPGLKGAALWDAITRAPIQPANARNPRLSRAFSRLLAQLLERRPEMRIDSASSLATRLGALRAGHTGALGRRLVMAAAAGIGVVLIALSLRQLPMLMSSSTAPTSWAVLRMNCDNADPEVAFYSEGVAVGLVGELSRLPDLRVTSWESSRDLCPGDTPVDAIANRLRAQRLLMGDVQISRGRLRIHAHIVDPVADRTLWSRSFSGDTSQVLRLQADVQRAVLKEVRRELPRIARPVEAEHADVDPAALRAYQRARYLWERRPVDLRLAIEYFEKAIAADSGYAAAWAGLADAWSAVGEYGLQMPVETRIQALRAARRAVELDDDLSEAHTALAHVLQNYDWDWQGAESEYRRAIAINPSNATAHHGYAHLLAQRKRFPEARREIQSALELNPNSVTSNVAVAVIHYYAREYPAALKALDDAAELDSTTVLAHRLRAAILDRMGREDEAIAQLARAAELQGQPAFAEGLRRANAAGGLPAALQLMIGALKAKRASGAYEPAEHVAELLARLGQVDEAIVWLETAYRERDTELNRLAADPLFDPLREHPRFIRLMQLVGLAEPTS